MEPKSLGQRFVDLLNEHVEITEADGTEEEGLEYLVARLRDNHSAALDRFVTDLFAFADRIAPVGVNVVVGEGTGFRLEDERKETA